jgi:hypothetical protein
VVVLWSAAGAAQAVTTKAVTTKEAVSSGR